MTYDASGNLINNGGGNTYTFDDENRLTATAGYTYVYDGDGNRVKKCSNSNCTTGELYWRGTGSDTLSESSLVGSITEEYIFLNGERIARRDNSGGAVHYYFADHLGSADVITDNLGNIQKQSDYFPYGGEIVITGSDINNYKFTGKERDQESGLDDFDARFYSSPFGRFMTPDWEAKPIDVPYANFGNPQSLNLYSYVQNNPTTIGDPDGHQDGCGCGFTTVYPQWDAFVNNLVSTTQQVLQQDVNAISNAVQSAAEALNQSGFGRGAMAGPDPIPGLGNTFFKEDQEASHASQPPQSGQSTPAQPPEGPQEPYDREEHYGKTPTAADKAAIGGESVDHEPPLVQRYYEGDAKAGEKPGFQQTPQERRASAQDRTRMQPSTNQEQRSQGGQMSKYSKAMKKKFKLFKKP
jgi:RHS repeat-associated protein